MIYSQPKKDHPTKKILIVSTIDKIGGTKTYLKNLLNYFNKKNVDINIATESVGEVRRLLAGLKGIKYTIYKLPTTYRFLTTLGSFSHPLISLMQYFSLKKILKIVQPDLMYVTPIGTTSYFASALFHLPKIFVIHSYPLADLSWFFKFILKVSPPPIRFLTVSKYSGKQINQHWHVNSSYIYNPPEIMNNFIFCQKRKYILTAGHIEWYKNPDVWLSTAKQVVSTFPSLQLKFVWVGSGSYKTKLRQKIVEAKLSAYCEVIEPRMSLASLYQQTYLYFQPSLVESQGIAVTTAQSLGIPAIVSNAGGLTEIVVNNKTGFIVEMNDYQEMASKILLLLKNQKLHTKLGNNAKTHIHNLMKANNWEEQMNQYLFDWIN